MRTFMIPTQAQHLWHSLRTWLLSLLSLSDTPGPCSPRVLGSFLPPTRGRALTSVPSAYRRPPYKGHSAHSPALCFLQAPNTALVETITFALEGALSYLQHTPGGRALQRREMFSTSQGTHRWKRLGGGNPTGERGAHPPRSPPGFGGRALTRGAVGCWPPPRRHSPPPPPPRCPAG